MPALMPLPPLFPPKREPIDAMRFCSMVRSPFNVSVSELGELWVDVGRKFPVVVWFAAVVVCGSVEVLLWVNRAAPEFAGSTDEIIKLSLHN